MKIPYSPLVALVESYVAIYKIYVLRNPLNNNEIFYVGQTFSSLEARLSQHISQTGSNRDKINYIKAIIQAGSRPIIESIEVIRGTCYIDKMMVNEREYYWIRYYKTLGCKLLNSAGTSYGSKCHEYHWYLSALKRGETSWHNYYCGKTAAGYEVYDQEKLKLDGFSFPAPPKIEEQKSESLFNYAPYENDLFLLKNGLASIKQKPTIEVYTEIFPPQPHWSAEFMAGLEYNNIFEDIEKDESDYESESCDYEDEEGFKAV